MKKMRFEIRILMKSFIDFLSRVLDRFKTLNTHLSIMKNMTKHMFNKSTCRVNMLNNLFNLTKSKSSTSRLHTVEISLLTIFFALILTLLISKQTVANTNYSQFYCIPEIVSKSKFRPLGGSWRYKNSFIDWIDLTLKIDRHKVKRNLPTGIIH